MSAEKKIKMVATDIDGTIVKWDTGFSDGVKNCIKNLCKKDVKILPSQSLISPPWYETTKQIIKWARDNNIHINLYIDDKLYVEKDNDCVKKYTDGKFVSYTVCSFDSLEIKNVNKILAIDYNDAERVTGWVEELQKKFPQLYIVKSTPYFCEIGSAQAKKSLGVEFLAKKWGLKKEEILTIGDQNNDIELLKAGGIKVAMGNGTPELKECADYITDTVENDGFVKAIEKYVIWGKNV